MGGEKPYSPPPPQNASHEYFNRVQTSKLASLSHLSLEAENAQQSAGLNRGRGGGSERQTHTTSWKVGHYLKNASCGIIVIGRETTTQWWLHVRLGRDALSVNGLGISLTTRILCI